MLQKIEFYSHPKVELHVLRTDILYPLIQGNKYYKLKYNLEEAKTQEKKILLTFGGAFSNHLYATAAAGKKYGFKTIGIVRGEAPQSYLHTLKSVEEMGMELHFVSRTLFRAIREENYQTVPDLLSHLDINWSNVSILPEGGTNDLALKGAAEIMEEVAADFDVVCVPVGTGGTVTGIINSLKGEKHVIGFSALKGGFLKNDVQQMLSHDFNNWEINEEYHFGGYGKWDDDLIHFINQFKQKQNIPLCPIYTGKMMYGILDLIKKNRFKKGAKILAIHTGGLQGIKSFNQLNGDLLV